MPSDPPSKATRMKLEDLLLRHGAIDEHQLARAREEQHKWGGEIGRILVELDFIGEEFLMRAMARQLSLPMVDPATAPIAEEITRAVPVQICERFGVIPISGDFKNRVLRFATSDPTNADIPRGLTVATNARIELACATSVTIERAIRKHYYGERVPGTGESEAVTDPATVGSLSGARPVSVPAPSAQWAELTARLDRLEEQLVSNPHFAGLLARVERLEQLAEAQLHVLRTIGDILVERGMITRDEYLRRARKS